MREVARNIVTRTRNKIRILRKKPRFIVAGELVLAGFFAEGWALISLLCALIGMGLEVFFTSTLEEKEDPDGKMEGYSSMLYAPLYGSVPLLYQLGAELGVHEWPMVLRGVIFYAPTIMVVEFLAMMFYDRALDRRPSKQRYLDSKKSVMGYTRPDFFFEWAVAGLFFEHIIRLLTRILPLL